MTAADLTLFLDFDGVLHPLWEPPPYNDWTLEQLHGPKAYAGPFSIHAPVLVELLRPHLPHLDIVISSLWARHRDLPMLKALLPLELADRVSDAIFHHGPASRVSRWMDIAVYRRDIRPDIGDRWLAIDDDDWKWPVDQRQHLAHCNRPLDDPAAQKAVRDALARFDPRRVVEI
jgi:hypothetical protein